ncbi:hypothetical protein [Streptomyces sp. NBC_01589]|uniref:hypothetical protein n=1 Tax=unclassified Streptomyces TaxID=2593676 RepID=UPI00386AD112
MGAIDAQPHTGRLRHRLSRLRARARAYIIRNNDGRQYSCKISPGQTQCYTPQVYDKDPLTSYAQSYVDGVTGEARTRTASG